MWDVNADVDALVDDFHGRFFGPAEAPMRDFFDQIEGLLAASPEHVTWTSKLGDWTRIYPPERARALGELLDWAEARADTPRLARRLAAYRALHDYMTTHNAMVTRVHEGRYREALAELERLSLPVEAAEAIQPGLLPPEPQWVMDSDRGLSTWRRYIEALVERDGGGLGRRLALGPATAGFRTDRSNEGLFEQWHLDEVAADLEWQPIPVTTDWTQGGHVDSEGYAYSGLGWYRFSASVPRAGPGAPARLYVPLVYADKMWVWANGHLVHSPTDELHRYGTDIDVSRRLRPGEENSFTFRMTGTWDRAQRHGLGDRWLLWTPGG